MLVQVQAVRRVLGLSVGLLVGFVVASSSGCVAADAKPSNGPSNRQSSSITLCDHDHSEDVRVFLAHLDAQRRRAGKAEARPLNDRGQLERAVERVSAGRSTVERAMNRALERYVDEQVGTLNASSSRLEAAMWLAEDPRAIALPESMTQSEGLEVSAAIRHYEDPAQPGTPLLVLAIFNSGARFYAD